MGANNSRLPGSGGEVLPAKIRPLLRRRVEELRRRRSGATMGREQEEEATFSKKHILNFDDESESSTIAKRGDSLSKVVPLPVEKKDEVVDSDEEEEEEEEENEEDDEIESGRFIGPASPSFKIYCIQPENSKREAELCRSNALGDHENQTCVFQKSPSANSVESSASADTNEMLQLVEMKSAPKRKGNKKQKFGAMKNNIFHVRHLRNRRHPMDCSSNERRNILTEH